jgi:Xaa-Pro dipeptidase
VHTSRRHFLQSTVGLSLSAASLASAQSDTDRLAAVPPSIAALASMRSRARPIAVVERRTRIERARQLMVESRIDALLLTGGTSLTYFTGARWGNSERLMALVIPARGDAFCVCPAFEEERVRELLATGPFTEPIVYVWQEDESPFARTAKALADRGVASGRVGIEENTKFVYTNSLATAAPALRLVDGTPVTAGCRMIKSDAEIALMRLASTATLTTYEAVFHALKPGMTETDVRGLVGAAYARLGFSGAASVQVGVYTALPHGSATPQTIREGTIIMFDDGCVVEGYQSDITRTFVLGRATDKMKRVFDIVKSAQTAALRAARPGVALETIDGAARTVISEAGYGPGFKYFTHRLGHGLGMDMHEWPYLVSNNMFGWDTHLIARPRMVFSDEPGIYIPGEFGIRLEDDMLITESGAELFTPQCASIEAPFARV